jgi:hypothetical protein
MLKLKNISQGDVTLEDLGMQLLHSNDFVELDNYRKVQASESAQLVVLISTEIIRVIDNDDVEIIDISQAVDLIKGFSQKTIYTNDKKIWVQSSARPIGTFTCFSSEGDSQDSPIKISDGTKMMIHHEIGDSLEQVLYIDFNVKENKTYISEGLAVYKDCNFDELHLHITPVLTPYISGTSTNFNLYEGFLIIPAAGDGTIQVDPLEINLVEIPFSIDDPTKRQSVAFWDADYNEQTHLFENLSPNIYGLGQYNIFGEEINLVTNVVMLLLGTNQIKLGTSDVAELGHGMRVKFVFSTNTPDHEWKCAVILTFNRESSAES